MKTYFPDADAAIWFLWWDSNEQANVKKIFPEYLMSGRNRNFRPVLMDLQEARKAFFLTKLSETHFELRQKMLTRVFLAKWVKINEKGSKLIRKIFQLNKQKLSCLFSFLHQACFTPTLCKYAKFISGFCNKPWLQVNSPRNFSFSCCKSEAN